MTALERFGLLINWKPGDEDLNEPLQKDTKSPKVHPVSKSHPGPWFENEDAERELLQNKLSALFRMNVAEAKFSTQTLKDLLSISGQINPFMKASLVGGKKSCSGEEIVRQALAKGSETDIVDLSNCHDIDDKHIQQLAQQCPNIRILNLCGLNSLTLKAIDALANFNKLIYLNLEACLYYPSNFKQIIEESYRNNEPESVRQEFIKSLPKLTNETLANLSPSWPHLKFLSLVGHGMIDSDGLEKALGKQGKSLIGLDLSGHLISRMTFLALDHFPHLKMLNLSHCYGVKAKHIDYLVKKHPSMASIILDRDSLGDKPLEAFKGSNILIFEEGENLNYKGLDLNPHSA